jgi:hypothetical protein
MPPQRPNDAAAQPPTALPDAPLTLPNGSGGQQHAAGMMEKAQPSGSVQEAAQGNQQQHATHAAHHAPPQAANGVEADGLWDSSAHSKPHMPQLARAHGHARSMSGLSAGSVPSVDFEHTAQPLPSSGFGDHVRHLPYCMPCMPRLSVCSEYEACLASQVCKM